MLIPDWIVRGATFMICNPPNEKGQVFGILLHVVSVDAERQVVSVEHRTKGTTFDMPLDDVVARAKSIQPPPKSAWERILAS